MSSPNYQKAVATNNEGVKHFESGNYQQARDMFRHALECIKSSMVDSQKAVNSTKSSPSNGLYWSKNAPLHSELNLSAPAGSSFIFRRALIIVPLSSHQLVSDLSEESTAIIYNLALSCLIAGFISNCSKLMRTGAQFFDIVLAIRQRKNESDKLSEEIFLDTAICNNLGWLHEEFCNYEKAQEYFQHVSSRLVTLSEGGFLDKQDCEGFITNLMLDSHPTLAAAA
jgi:tetratricopeptide (TPR) repeat protein